MHIEEEKTSMPPDGARLIQDVLAELGWSADAVAVADQVRRLDIGLPVEDEFSVLCAWLGKCQILHKLDQQQVPVLIEVKSKKDSLLSFTPKYMGRLLGYADLVGMPLLIAWKFHSVWTLFEVRHMKKAAKNFNIKFETALRENLLGVLVGDVAYKIGAGAGVHLRFRKDKLLGRDIDDNGHTDQCAMTLDDIGFTDRDGSFRMDLDKEVQSLFSAWDLEETEERTDSHVHLRYVAGDESISFAHTALVHLLNWESPNDGQPH